MTDERPYKRLFRLPSRSRDRIAEDLDEEMDFHLALRVEEYRAAGLTDAEARAAARRRFGNLEEAKAYCRALDRRAELGSRRRERLTSLLQDLRGAARQLRRSPGFAVAAVLTLALGIGANVAIFSVTYRLLLAPLPFPEGERLVSLVRVMPQNQLSVSPGTEELRAMREHAKSLAWIAPFASGDVLVDDGDGPRIVPAVRIDRALPALLDNSPLLGRSFLEEETVRGGPPAAILGYAMWTARFGRDPEVLGRTISVDGVRHVIVGVMPNGFDIVERGRWLGAQLWLPFVEDAEPRGITVLAKLRDSVTLSQANAEAAVIGRNVASDADDLKFVAKLIPIRGEASKDLKRMLSLLMGAVAVVLLIACANVASLLLGRATARAREIAVRMALGAGRRRIVRQLLTESALLALLGGAAGVAVAQIALKLIVAVRPEQLSSLDTVRLEPIVLGWCLAISALTGLMFGLAPALVSVGGKSSDALRGTAGAGGMGVSRHLRTVLVVGELALSVVLLVAAGLLVRTVLELRSKDLGFVPGNIVATRIELPREAFSSSDARRVAMIGIRDAVAALPGMRSVTLAQNVPPQTGIIFGALEIDGVPVAGGEQTMLEFNAVEREYFEQLEITLLDGRLPDTKEWASSPSAVIVSRSLAEQYWPGQPAVGHRMRIDNGEWRTVIGIVNNVRAPGNSDDFLGSRQMYLPPSFDSPHAQLVMLPSSGANPSFANIVRTAATVNPAIRVREYRTLSSAVAEGVSRERFTMALLAAFAIIAVGLAAVGLYAVVAYSVARRNREIGVRIAVGADPAQVQRMVLAQAARMTSLGLALGLVAAAAMSRLMQSLLYGVSPVDARTYVAVAVLLGAISVMASWLPARRAARVHPMAALRAD